MIELRTTESPRTWDEALPPTFAHDGDDIEESDAAEDFDGGPGGDFALDRDPAAGTNVWRMRPEMGRAPSGWMFVESEGSPIRFDAAVLEPSAWSLSRAIGHGHLVAFPPALDAAGGRSRAAGAVMLVSAVIMGIAPSTAAAAATADPASWDELTQDVDPADPAIPRYGSKAVMATDSPRVQATANSPATTAPDDWSQLVGSEVIMVGATGTVLGTLVLVDAGSVVMQLPSGEARTTTRDKVSSIAPASAHGGPVYSPTYGKSRVVSGGVLTGIGGAAFVAGVGIIAYSKSWYKLWAPLLVPGVVMAAVGIPLLITGLQRKRRRGQPVAANLRVAPVVTRTFTGAGLHLRF